MDIMKVENLNKVYITGGEKIHAVNNTSFNVREGELLAIVGESGGGKSTLLHLLGGLDKPNSGKVIIDGKDIYSMNNDQRAIFRRRNIGFIFQSFNLVPVLTAYENILLPISLDKGNVDKARLNDIIKILGIEKRLNHFPNQLSGGEQQRVAIARALAYKPQVVLADEPTGNLDKRNSEEIMDMLKLICLKSGTTIIMVTHDLTLASKADRIIKVEDGRVII